MAQTAHVITHLTKKGTPNKISWEKHQDALDELMYDLNHVTAVNTIDYSKHFGLSIDASAVALGCCLFQWDNEGLEVPISFGSLKLSTIQTR